MEGAIHPADERLQLQAGRNPGPRRHGADHRAGGVDDQQLHDQVQRRRRRGRRGSNQELSSQHLRDHLARQVHGDADGL